LVALTAVGGCAALATKPPTPADDISPRTAAAREAPADERYFLLIFGSQSRPKVPRYTHTWATLVTVRAGGGPDGATLQEDTISWMPRSLEIRTFSLHVEPGINLTMQESIDEMLRNNERVAVWGPYEVRAGTAYRFQVQRAFIESGRVGYQCIDNIGEAARTGGGCNCAHAISDMDPLFDRNQYPLAYFGDSASLNLVRQFQTRPVIICPDADHGWLLSALGLANQPIERRTYRGRSVPSTPENVERYLQRHGE
jgi:hypothetical protein